MERYDFGWALARLEAGQKVARKGWNGKGMFLVYVPGSVQEIREASVYAQAGITGSVTINPHIDLMTATGEMQPGWVASQTDMFALDWTIVN